MKRLVHATRGYLAGFGTSGSLLAGAAVLFLLASAIVAFRGWPEVGTGPAISAVSAPQASAPSHAGQRLAVLLRRGLVLGTGGAGRTSLVGTRRRTGRLGAVTHGVGAVTPTSATSPTGAGGAAGTVAGTGTPSSAAPCGVSGCTPAAPQSVITQTANLVAQEVSNVGGSVGAQAQSTSQPVANDVSNVSPQAGSAVQSAGQAVSGTVTGTATTAGNAVSQVGSTLGGGH